MPTLTFPELSRKPALKTRQRTLDPTLRDPMENGMEADTAQWTRLRREWDITIDLLTQADVDTLEDFVENKAVAGVNEFLFVDARNPQDPRTLTVKFATLPSYVDKDGTEDGVRQTCTFTLRSV